MTKGDDGNIHGKTERSRKREVTSRSRKRNEVGRLGTRKRKARYERRSSPRLRSTASDVGVLNFRKEEEDNEDDGDHNYENKEEEEEDMEHGDAVAMLQLEWRNSNRGKAAIDGEDIDDIFEHGIVSRPKNPYFVTKLREKRRTELFIPKDVIQVYRLELPQKLIIRDEEGREFQSNVKRWEDGRTWLTDGWKGFCKWNCVKREDRCLCEFMHGEGTEGIYLKIRVLREGSWLP